MGFSIDEFTYMTANVKMTPEPRKTPDHDSEEVWMLTPLIPQGTKSFCERFLFLLSGPDLGLCRCSLLQVLLKIYTSFVRCLRHEAVDVFLWCSDSSCGRCDILVELGRGIDIFELLLKVDHDSSNLKI